MIMRLEKYETSFLRNFFFQECYFKTKVVIGFVFKFQREIEFSQGVAKDQRANAEIPQSLFSLALADIGKSVIGWPRPNFMAYCQPNVTCTAEDTNKHTYITNFKCLNLDSQDELEDALKSFPSAHASFAAYVAFFLAFYIQDRFQAFANCLTLKTVIGPFLQLCIIASFWWSALTRVSDYVHHPLDVLAGLILGTLVATWTRTYLQYLIQAIDQTHKTLKYSLN